MFVRPRPKVVEASAVLIQIRLIEGWVVKPRYHRGKGLLGIAMDETRDKRSQKSSLVVLALLAWAAGHKDQRSGENVLQTSIGQ